MAVEDAAALAAILVEVKNQEEIHEALKIFEKVRILRSGQMQRASLTNGKIWHYADGLEQQARDAAMRPEVLGTHFIESPNQWSDPVTQAWCYGYDAEEEVRRQWRLRDRLAAQSG
jgi:salicylate hydroxylase